MVEWLKLMVQQKQFEDVVDKELEIKPSTSELKRALLTALRCVDPDADKRPKMSQVARMLESDEYPVMPREVTTIRTIQNQTLISYWRVNKIGLMNVLLGTKTKKKSER